MRTSALFLFLVAFLMFPFGAMVTYEQVSASKIPPPITLCEQGEKVVFSCQLKSAKIVSLCGSKKLTKTEGYLQYRFGLPEKIELEFPTQRSESQKSLHYSHYFRARFDETEISFSKDDHTYTVFHNFNGEQKPAITDQGIRVTPPAGKKEVTLTCRGQAQADFADLPDAFENEYGQP